jgi:hypothetical protein
LRLRYFEEEHLEECNRGACEVAQSNVLLRKRLKDLDSSSSYHRDIRQSVKTQDKRAEARHFPINKLAYILLIDPNSTVHSPPGILITSIPQ